MNKLFIFSIILNAGEPAVPASIHASQQACEDKAYVVYENSEQDGQCHVIVIGMEFHCTTDSICEDFWGWDHTTHVHNAKIITTD